MEAKIRRGDKALPEPRLRRCVTNASAYCEAFMRDYIMNHAQSDPGADNIKYLDFCVLDDLYTKYTAEKCGSKRVSYSTFCRLWQKVVREGVTDPETSMQYQVQVKKKTAKGFKMCSKCSYLRQKIGGTSNKTKRAFYERELRKHAEHINDDRETLARIVRMCTISKHHCGFYLDAADSAKFAIPTTESTAKILEKLWRIRQKLTAVQMFDEAKSLHFFRSLPQVPTGGNLTGTILTYIFANVDFHQCSDLWINVDGAGDNICYTLQYYFAYVLMCARKNGWTLERIHLLRMKVGHTYTYTHEHDTHTHITHIHDTCIHT